MTAACVRQTITEVETHARVYRDDNDMENCWAAQYGDSIATGMTRAEAVGSLMIVVLHRKEATR